MSLGRPHHRGPPEVLSCGPELTLNSSSHLSDPEGSLYLSQHALTLLKCKRGPLFRSQNAACWATGSTFLFANLTYDQ